MSPRTRDTGEMQRRTVVAGLAVAAAAAVVKQVIAQQRAPWLTASDVGQRVRDQVAAGGLQSAIDRANAPASASPSNLKTRLQDLNVAAQRVAGRAVDRLAARAGIPTSVDYPIARSSGDRMVEGLRAAGYPTTGRSDHEMWQEVT
jgi:hypothetical protein